MGKKRDAYVEKLKSQLDEWNVKIDKLEKTADLAKSEVEVEYRDRMAQLRAKRDELEGKLKEVQGAGEDAWEILKDGVEKAQMELKLAFDDAMTRVSEHTPDAPNN